MPNKSKGGPPEAQRPPQTQPGQPGVEAVMRPRPQVVLPAYKAAGKLEGKAALVTGGDSGIGRAVAVHFAKEGADVAIVYLEEHEDARETKRLVEAERRQCVLLPCDVQKERACLKAVKDAVAALGGLDILVNNAGIEWPQDDPAAIPAEQLERTFRTNIHSMFHMTKAALPHLREGAAIINTSSVTAYRGSPHLLDYSATKGAIVSYTRSLSGALAKRGIRVNAVAPGPVWTPLVAAANPPDKNATFGSDVPLGRAAEPGEIAPCYVFLACSDSSYMTGQVLHPNGGEIVNG